MIPMKDDQNQCQFPNSSLISSCDQGAINGYYMPQQQEPNGLYSIGASSNQSQEIHDPTSSIGGSSISRHVLHQTNDNKWMPSKMRWIRKMLVSNQRGRTPPSTQDGKQLDQACNNNSSASGIIRVCSNCSTTKTPLWRGGPQGPKSLCNACGIRQMKARRAMRANVDNTIPLEKRFKNINTSSSSTSTGSANNNNNKTMKKKKKKKRKHVRLLEEVTKRKLTFPQEERDAAILLMALSCGLIHG